MESNHHSHIVMHSFLHSKMGKLYIFQALLSFAKSMIGVFVPVYLFKIGFEIHQILLYVMITSIFVLLALPIATKLIKKIGFKYTIFATIPIYLLHILTINFIQTNNYIYIISSALFGIYCAMFWPAYHTEVIKNSDKKHMSSQIGNIQIIVTLVSTLAPLIGGYILENQNFLTLFTIAGILILIGIIPLLMSVDIKLDHYKFSSKAYLKVIKSKKHKNCIRAFAAQGIDTFLLLIIWPIIIFILFKGNFFTFGTFVTIVSLITVLIVYFIKQYFDKMNKEKILKKTFRTISIGWLMRSLTFVFGFLYLYFVEGVLKIAQNVGGILFSSIFYSNANKLEKYLDYIITREIVIHTIRIMLLAILIPVFFYIKGNLVTLSSLLIIGIITSWIIGGFKEINPENL